MVAYVATLYSETQNVVPDNNYTIVQIGCAAVARLRYYGFVHMAMLAMKLEGQYEVWHSALIALLTGWYHVLLIVEDLLVYSNIIILCSNATLLACID